MEAGGNQGVCDLRIICRAVLSRWMNPPSEMHPFRFGLAKGSIQDDCSRLMRIS